MTVYGVPFSFGPENLLLVFVGLSPLPPPCPPLSPLPNPTVVGSGLENTGPLPELRSQISLVLLVEKGSYM